ncbi:hypothetical protein AVHM3334_00040 [Acidovorax sp. SUPP3334]|nr:hypothetical protein AVHM3334_00040 [Acidovorax sp. SUPP3334]
MPITEPSLGLLISNGYQYLLSNEYWVSFFPGLALLFTSVAINLVGDQLRDVLNPEAAEMMGAAAFPGAPTLEVRDLRTRFHTRAGVLPVVETGAAAHRRRRWLVAVVALWPHGRGTPRCPRPPGPGGAARLRRRRAFDLVSLPAEHADRVRPSGLRPAQHGRRRTRTQRMGR